MPSRSLAGLLVAVVTIWSVAKAPAQEANGAAWQTTKFKGLSLETPFPLKPLPDASGQNRVVMEGTDASIETKQGEGNGIMIVAAMMEYKAAKPPGLEAEVRRMLEHMAAPFHLAVPEYTIRDTTVSGLPARDVSANFVINSAGGKAVLVTRSLVFGSGISFGQVMVIQLKTGSEVEATVKRVLGSVAMEKAGN